MFLLALLSFIGLSVSQPLSSTCYQPFCPSNYELVNNSSCISTLNNMNIYCPEGLAYNLDMQNCFSQYLPTADQPCNSDFVPYMYQNKEYCAKFVNPLPCPANYTISSLPDGKRVCMNVVEPYCNDFGSDNGFTPSSIPSPRASMTPTPNNNYTEMEINCTKCDSGSVLFENEYCLSNVTEVIMKCNAGDRYQASSNTCIKMYPISSATSQCEQGYTLQQSEQGMYCVKSYIPEISCPLEYYEIMMNGKKVCGLLSMPECENECICPSQTVLNLTINKCEMVVQPFYNCNGNDTYIAEKNMCYSYYVPQFSADIPPRCDNGYALISNSDGTMYCKKEYQPMNVVCPSGTQQMNNNGFIKCLYYIEPFCVGNNSSDYNPIPTMTPRPSQDSVPSISPRVSQNSVPSISPRVSQDSVPSISPRVSQDSVPSMSPIPTRNCTNLYCDYPSMLVNNKYCVWNITELNVFCNNEDYYNPNNNKCYHGYPKIIGKECETGYTVHQMDGVEYCAYTYEPSSTCPNGFINWYIPEVNAKACALVSNPRCLDTNCPDCVSSSTPSRKPVEPSVSPRYEIPTLTSTAKPIEPSMSKTPYPTRRISVSPTQSQRPIELPSRSPSITPKPTIRVQPSSIVEPSKSAAPSVYVRPSMSAKPSNIPTICTTEFDQHICIFENTNSNMDTNINSRVFSNLCYAKLFYEMKKLIHPDITMKCVRKCEELPLDKCNQAAVCQQNNDKCDIRDTCNKCNGIEDISNRRECCQMRNFYSEDEYRCRYDDMRDICFSTEEIREVSTSEIMTTINQDSTVPNKINLTSVANERINLDLGKVNTTNFRLERMENMERIVMETLSLGSNSELPKSSQERQRLTVDTDITIANMNINGGAEIVFNSGDIRIEEKVVVQNNSRLTLGRGTTLSGSSTVGNSIAEISGEISIPSSVNLERQQIKVQQGGTMLLGDKTNSDLKRNETSITMLRNEAKIEISKGAEMQISSKSDVIIQSEDKTSSVINTGVIKIDMKQSDSNQESYDKGTVELRAPIVSSGLLDIKSSDVKIKEEFTSTGEIKMEDTDIIVGNIEESIRRLRFLQEVSSVRFNIRGNSTSRQRSIMNINDKTKLELGKGVLSDIQYSNLIVNGSSKLNMTKDATTYIEETYIKVSNRSNLTISSTTLTMYKNIIDIQNKSRIEITTNTPISSDINIDKDSIMKINNTFNRMSNTRSRRLQTINQNTLLVNGELSGIGTLDYNNVKVEGNSATLKPEGNLLIAGDLHVDRYASIQLSYTSTTTSKLSVDGVANVDGLISITRSDPSKPIPVDFFQATSYSFGSNAALAVDGQVIPNALQGNQINMNLLTSNNVVENDNNNLAAKLGGGIGAGVFVIALVAGIMVYKIKKNKSKKIVESKPVGEIVLPQQSVISNSQNPANQYQVVYLGRRSQIMMPQNSTKSLFNPIHATGTKV